MNIMSRMILLMGKLSQNNNRDEGDTVWNYLDQLEKKSID